MKFPALDRQKEIYLNGFSGTKPSVPVSSCALEEVAKKKMSPQAYAYIAGGAGSESTLRENRRVFEKYKITTVVHFAAESHVDRSIHNAQDFIRTNIEGTFQLLQAARQYWTGLPENEKESFRFLLVSTDEVYGSLGPEDPAFTEKTPFSPNSPYAASKAASATQRECS